jgi:glycosyltransferase involved in cell wall biosynthesis
MTDLAVIILQKNEALHIRRCLEKLKPLEPRQMFVVDCFSTDGSDKNAKEMGATVVYHEWPGNQAAQFNWALDNLPIETTWILRLDADEYLTDDLLKEIVSSLPKMGEDVEGIVLKRRLYFRGKWVKYGIYPTRILRLFRTGRARYDDSMAMDEHLLVQDNTVELDYDFVDESLISFDDWKAKHHVYAEREARMALSGTVNANKRAYYRLPRYLRAFAYFCIRYFLKGGFLDGWAGLYWNFWQGLWYRCLVDKKIGELKGLKV